MVFFFFIKNMHARIFTTDKITLLYFEWGSEWTENFNLKKIYERQREKMKMFHIYKCVLRNAQNHQMVSYILNHAITNFFFIVHLPICTKINDNRLCFSSDTYTNYVLSSLTLIKYNLYNFTMETF